jgi:hypothetical protein
LQSNKKIAILKIKQGKKWHFYLLGIYYMIFKINLIKLFSGIAAVLFYSNSYSQKTPNIRNLNEETIDEVKIDFDKDGDLDLIVAGVFVKKNQGRVYAIRNNGLDYAKPEFIFSFPSIGRKQKIEVKQEGAITTIVATGTSPTGKKDKFTATLFNGRFEGLIPPISFDSID